MLGIGEDGRPSAKCYVTCGALQGYINPEQPPTKKQPYSTIRSSRFNHTVRPFFFVATVQRSVVF